jgi:alanine racemase
VDYLGVAFADEGISLKNVFIYQLYESENTSFAAIIQYQLEPEIYCLKGLLLFKKIKRKRICITLFISN